jgi:hypothetical protein
MIRRMVYALRESGALHHTPSSGDFLLAARMLEAALDPKAEQAAEHVTWSVLALGRIRID